MNRLVGKVAVVTGAGRGVGRAYANALAAEGAKVLVNDLGVSVEGVGSGAMAADEAVAEIRAAGGIAAANYDDVSNFAGAGRLIKTAVDIYGSLDILVANAGVIRPTNLFEAKEEDWNSVLAVHANGTFNCYRHGAPIMMRQSGGTIITTGADVDRYLTRKDAYPGLGAYRAAKAAILVLTLSAADELRPYNINVNSIMPGSTATRMQGAFYESLQARGVSVGDLKAKWPKAVPAETVPPLGIFLCTAEGRSITGRGFTVNGGRITMLLAPSPIATIDAAGEYWTIDALTQQLPQWVNG